MKEEIIDFKHFVQESKIVVIKRIRSHSMYATNPTKPVPDTVIKEIYGVENGVITLVEQIKGKHEPEYTVKEKFIF